MKHIKYEKNVRKQKKTRIYSIYNAMLGRCRNPSDDAYKYYGGKGILVCEEWIENYDNFADWAYNNGYSDDLTIDRINPNDNYSPNNCRWISMAE